MNRRPLYLHATEPVEVAYEAPALCIRAESKADRIFPLRRVARIQVRGPVAWETAAILACAEEGISIHFIDARERTRARLVGTVSSKSGGLAAYLQRMFNNPRWRPRYRQWCWARRQQTQRYAAWKLGYRYQEARDLSRLPKWCEKILAEHADSREISNVLQWMHLDLYGFVTDFLQRRGLWEQSPLALEEPIDLARDMTEILQGVLLLVRHRRLRGHDRELPVDRKLVASWFAQQNDYFDYQTARVVNLLEIWIMETT